MEIDGVMMDNVTTTYKFDTIGDTLAAHNNVLDKLSEYSSETIKQN